MKRMEELAEKYKKRAEGAEVFTLSSGKVSPVYYQCEGIKPGEWDEIAEELLDRYVTRHGLRSLDPIRTVVGLQTGGLFLAEAIFKQLFNATRWFALNVKQPEPEYEQLSMARPEIFLVDDVISTGTQMRRASELLKDIPVEQWIVFIARTRSNALLSKITFGVLGEEEL